MQNLKETQIKNKPMYREDMEKKKHKSFKQQTRI
ncbi:hypothetical protein Y592_05010 [Thermosipho sp. 1070]|nr:hypothetical protein Y592_05010 [Thermosipho sp. 1070]